MTSSPQESRKLSQVDFEGNISSSETFRGRPRIRHPNPATCLHCSRTAVRPLAAAFAELIFLDLADPITVSRRHRLQHRSLPSHVTYPIWSQYGLNVMKLIENLLLKAWQIRSIDGTLCIDRKVLDRFLAAPFDPLPEFEGAPNYQLKNNGRGKDHPRYGRFVYALARHFRPETIVEVGTFAAIDVGDSQ